MRKAESRSRIVQKCCLPVSVSRIFQKKMRNNKTIGMCLTLKTSLFVPNAMENSFKNNSESWGSDPP